MDNVVSFPPSLIAPPMTDPPIQGSAVEDLRRYAIELEHENCDLKVALADQAVRLTKKKRVIDNANTVHRLRISAAILIAFGWGVSLHSFGAEAHTDAIVSFGELAARALIAEMPAADIEEMKAHAEMWDI